MSSWIKLIFLRADCDAITFGKTNILLYIFDFQMLVFCSFTC